MKFNYLIFFNSREWINCLRENMACYMGRNVQNPWCAEDMTIKGEA